jgi:hypothetical protein
MDNTNEIIQGLVDLLALDTFRTFAASDLVQRFASVEDKYRHDPVIRNVGGAIEKIAKKEPSRMITAEEVSKLYNSFVGLNPQTPFREIFTDILPMSEEAKIAAKNAFAKKRIPYSNVERDLTTATKDAIEVDEYQAALEQPVEVLGVEKVVPTPALAAHKPELIKAGSELVKSQLEALGCTNIRTSLKFGSTKGLLYLASFPTTAGTIHINVPLVVENEQPEVPELFADISGKTTYAFNEAGVEKLVNDAIEDRRTSDLNAADAIRHNYTSDVVREPTKAAAIEVDEVQAYVEEIVPPKLSTISPELADVEAILEDAIIRKDSRYNEQTIGLGRSLVSNEFKQIGYKSDVRFAGDHNKGMFFDATLWTKKGKVEVSVPVEVAEGNVLFPSQFVADDGEVRNIEPHQVAAMLDKEELVEVPRYSAAFVEMDYNSLRKVIHAATFDRKHNVAREALHLIQDKFGTDAHNTAVADYQEWIAQASADYSTRCGECKYYKPRGITISSMHKSASDYCNLLHEKCSKITRKAGVCTRAHLEWNKTHDDSYRGIIMTSQVRLT